MLAACADPSDREPEHDAAPHDPLIDGGDGERLDARADARRPMDAAPAEASTPREDARTGDAAQAHEAPLVVRVASGLLEGTRGGEIRGHTWLARRFLGIPYAQPPVGDLRFAPPRPAAPWHGTKSAKVFGPRCIGIALGAPPEGRSEDCLSLNVFTPATLPAEPLPVLVFLHGGGFATGSSVVEAQWLSERGAVVVSMNYRVGALGFMTHPALDRALETSSGNMGLRDQQLGLRWVRDNIAAFGGDPARVLLFGESAGALSTCAHMFAAGSDKLADAFLMESGSCIAGTGRVRPRADVLDASEQLARWLCPLDDDESLLACLRTIPALEFATAWAPGVADARFWPHVDGTLFKDSPRALLARGEFARAPLIVGSNLNERRFFDDRPISPVADRLTLALTVRSTYLEHADAILTHYMPASDADAKAAWVRLWTDEYFRCPARLLARMASDREARAYLFSFDVAPAVHSQELDYVFGFPCCGVSSEYPDEAPNPLLRAVVDAMQGHWINFARNGDPNGAGLSAWPPYDRNADEHLKFADPIAIGSALAKDDCDFWDAIYAEQP